MQNKKYVISLFAGCGGTDVGMHGGFTVNREQIVDPQLLQEPMPRTTWATTKTTSFETILANDIRPKAKIAFDEYFGTTNRDVYQVDSIVDMVKRYRDGQYCFPDADVVTGGFPCQDFSLAGKRLGFKSRKRHTVFIAENVKGLVTLGGVKKIIEEDFRTLSDGTSYLVLPARVYHCADYGVAQNRERVIFLGLRKDAMTRKSLEALVKNPLDPTYTPVPAPTHARDGEGSPRWVTVKAILEGLSEPEYSEDPAQRYYSKARFYGKHCQGNKEINLEGVAPTMRAEHHGNIEFRRLSKANGGSNEPLLPERRLTVREAARIQSFPDEYQFATKSVGGGESYRLIGNAIPPLFAFHFAVRLESVWDKLFR